MNAPQLYIVTCTCGEKFRVRSSQAGEQLRCKCGETVSVPTIRGLKQLETVKDDRPVVTVSSPWQGPIFASGVLALFVGLLMLAGTALFPPPVLQADVAKVDMSEEDATRAAIPAADLTMDQLYKEFVFLRDHGRSENARYVMSQVDQARNGHQRMWFASGAITGIGTLLTIIGLILPALQSKPR